MTTPAHATMTAGITIAFTDDVRVIVAMVLLAILPDAIRLIDKKWNGFYLSIHRPDKYFGNRASQLVVYGIWILFWPIGLHCIIDLPLHKDSGGWRKYSYLVEVLFWLVIVAYCIVGFSLFNISLS